MSRIRSLSALSALFILAAGLVAVGGSTRDAAAAGAAAAAPSDPYQVAIRHDDGSVETMPALSWSHEIFDVGTAASAGGLPSGKRLHKPFVITKKMDKSSPILLKACATGEHFPSVQLDAFRTRQGRGELYLTITLEEVLVSSFQTSGGDATELEHIAFSYAKITFNYRDHGVVFKDDVKGGE